MKEFSKNIENTKSKILKEAIEKQLDFLGLKEWKRVISFEEATYVSGDIEEDKDWFYMKAPSGRPQITLEEFFSLKPEPKLKTITLELTEEQETLVRTVLNN
jgi:hypothetical protein